MSSGLVLEVAGDGATCSSNFLPSVVRMRVCVEREIGPRSLFVPPEAARERTWVGSLAGTGMATAIGDARFFLDRSVLTTTRTPRQAVADASSESRLRDGIVGPFPSDQGNQELRRILVDLVCAGEPSHREGA